METSNGGKFFFLKEKFGLVNFSLTEVSLCVILFDYKSYTFI